MSNKEIDTLKKVISLGGSRFTSVVFTKKNGSVRRISFQPSRNKEARKDTQIVVFDHSKKGYRTVNLDTVSEIRVNGLRMITATN